MIGRPIVTLTAVAKGQQLDRDQSLIVIAGDHAVELAARRAHEHGVAGNRAGDVDAAGAGARPPPARARDRLRRRCTPPSPACGLSPRQRQSRPRRRRTRVIASTRERDRAIDELRRDVRRHVAQRHVHGDQHDLQLRRVKHHRHARRAAEVRQQIGVALPLQPGLRKGELVDRRGRNRVDLACPARRRRRGRSCRRRRGRRRRTPVPGVTPASGGANTIGSHTARTDASAAALAAISGPMPAGSPTVIAIFGFVTGSGTFTSRFAEKSANS